MRAILLISLISTTCIAATMRNADVVRMVHRGSPVSDIISRINNSESGFRLFPEDVDRLRKGGVPDLVIKAMEARQTGAKLDIRPDDSGPKTTTASIGSATENSRPSQATLPVASIPEPRSILPVPVPPDRPNVGIASAPPAISEGEVYGHLRIVFDRITQVSGGPAVQLYFDNTPDVNAYAYEGGQLHVTSGLMQAIDGNEGVLAFVMGHELGHIVSQHSAKRNFRLRGIDYEYRQLYIQSGQLAAGIYLAAAKITEMKVERDEENEADRLGLRIAAEAGYHPDYALLGERIIHARVGDNSKFAAFFSNHPRWATREDRAERDYDEAVEVFNRRWPSVEKSPGGRPPAIAIVSPIRINKQGRDLVASTSIRVRNLREPVEARFELIAENSSEQATIGSKWYVTDQAERDLLSVTLTEQTLKQIQRAKQSIRLRVFSPSYEYYRSNLVRVK